MNPQLNDFSDLFDPAERSQAVDMVGRIFGDIVQVVQGGTGGYSTWLNSLVELFNFAGLFGVMVVSLYTVLTVFFDSAKDGQVFGNQTDARYTMMRVLSGAVAFIPVKSGFSIAQLLLIWLVVQGSALGDRAWKLVAEQNLQGSSFIGASRLERAEDGGIDQTVRVQLGEAFTGLVNGFLCQKSLNTIHAAMNSGEEGATVADNSPVEFVRPADLTSEVDEFVWAGWRAGYADSRRYDHAMYFRDTTNSYSGSRQLCGGVSYTQTGHIAVSDPGDFNVNKDYLDPLRQSMMFASIRSYHEAMLGGPGGGLVGAAEEIARDIWSGTVSDNSIRQRAIEAVDNARMIYVTRTSSRAAELYDDEMLGNVMRDLRDKVTMDGWVMAAAWQRGLSLAGAEARKNMSFSNLNLDVTKETNVLAAISPSQGLASGTTGGWGGSNGQMPTVVADLVRHFQATQTRWETIAPAVRLASRGGSADAPTSVLNDGAAEMQGMIGRFYRMILNALSVRKAGDAYNDPMVDVQEFGEGMMIVGTTITAAGFLTEIALSRVPVIGDAAGALIKPIGFGFLAVGFAATAIIPMIPIVYFYSAVISWLILIVESMFALPLAILSLFTPSRDGTLIGSWNRILLSIFGIFLRPLFTVAGLLFGMLLIAVALDFSNALFLAMLGIMAPTGDISNLFTMLGIVTVSTLVTFYTVMLGSSMITEIGDGAMNLFGIGLSQVGNRMSVGDKMQRGLGEGIMPTRLAPGGGVGSKLMTRNKEDGSLAVKGELTTIRRGVASGGRAVRGLLPGRRP